MFASTFDDFWSLPSGGRSQQQQQPPAPQKQPQYPSAQPQQAQQPQTQRVAKTMEEIEADMRAARLSQQQQQQPQGAAPRQLTAQEVEAQMMAQRQQGMQSMPPQMMGGRPPMPPGMFPPGMPPHLMSMMLQQQGQFPQHFPPPPPQFQQAQQLQQQQLQQAPVRPAPSAGPRHDSEADFPALGSAGPARPAGVSSTAAPAPPLAPVNQNQQPAVSHAEEQEHFARMKALLAALPQAVQQRITSLPAHMHFNVLEGVSREFAILLEPPTAASAEAKTQAEAAALQKLDVLHSFEAKKMQRAQKIANMARYNNLMTVSDKEFITRIQISQIITADPYADDFYAHIYFALRGRPGPNPGLMGAPPSEANPAEAPSAQQPPKGPRRGGNANRMNAQQKAMLRMQQQVERLVADRKARIEKASEGKSNPNLEGALGKTGLNLAGNPRQSLQIKKDGKASDGSAAGAVEQALQGAGLGDGGATSAGNAKRDPLTKHETLRILEKLYDTVLNLEQLRRSLDETDSAQAAEQEALTATLWKELRVLEPLEISDPHPFVSLLGTTKGKRLLPRALRHLSQEQTLTALTMIVASFDTLDVVREAPILDDITVFIPGANSSEKVLDKKREVELQTETFSNTIVPAMMGLMQTSPMKIVIGMLALFVERNHVVKVVQSRAGIAFLTILLSRAESLRQAGQAAASDAQKAALGGVSPPTPEELQQWSSIYQLLFQRLITHSNGGLSNLFPSTRCKAALPFSFSANFDSLPSLLQSHLDELDEPIWNLFAALAISSSMSMDQQSILVQELREKILENVLEAKGKSRREEGERKLRLVNIFLNALGLDASQIVV